MSWDRQTIILLAGNIYSSNHRVGLRVANACSRNRSVFCHILLDGLSRADPSTIRQWIKCVVPRLGVVMTVKVIASSDSCDPLLGEACIYWIESMRLRPSKRETWALAKLKKELSERRPLSTI